jgi:trigger factor
MNVTVETLSPVERKLTIEVEPERVAQELDRAYAALGRRVKLRGFRPGHVPRGVLERNFRSDVEGEVAEKVVAAAFAEAARERSLQPVAPPHVSIEAGVVPGAAFRFSAKVEVKPAVVARDYTGLPVARGPVAVADAAVDEELAKIQDRFAQLVPVEGREVAEEGDWAVIDHEGTIDGQPFEGGRAEGVSVRVGEGKTEEGFLPRLRGARVGETVEFDEAFPDDHRSATLRGKTTRMKVTLRGLRSRQLPAIDDALAAQLGIEGLATLEALRARIRSDLEKREARKVEAEFKDALIKAALERNDFEVPPSMVERAIDGMIEGTAERFARMGVDLRQLELDVARLRADLREQALLQVRGALLLEAVAAAEAIEVSDEELSAEMAKVAEEMGVPLATVQREMRGKEARAALQIRVREEKALAVLAGATTPQP